MKRIFSLILVFVICCSTQLVLADSDEVLSYKKLDNQGQDQGQDRFNKIQKLESDINFNRYSRWYIVKYPFLYKGENHFNVFLKNTGNRSFKYAIANNSKFIRAIKVGTVKPGKSVVVKLKPSDVINIHKNSNMEPTFMVHVQVTSPGNRVKGRFRLAGRPAGK